MSPPHYPILDTFLKENSNFRPSEKPVAVFDCDGTIIQGDIGEAMFYLQIERFLFRTSPANIWLDFPKREELDNLYSGLVVLPPERRAHDRRFISFAEMLLWWYFSQLEEGKTEKACVDIVRLFARFTVDEVRQIARTTFDEEISALMGERTLGRRKLPRGIRYVKDAVDILTQLQTHGFDIWAISGSNKWSVEPVFEKLKVGKDHIVGVELIETNDLLSAKSKSPIPVLQGKVRALQERLPRPPLVVVGDSIYDVPLFKYSAGLKILINSDDAESFFAESNIDKDESWLVVNESTLQL